VEGNLADPIRESPGNRGFHVLGTVGPDSGPNECQGDARNEASNPDKDRGNQCEKQTFPSRRRDSKAGGDCGARETYVLGRAVLESSSVHRRIPVVTRRLCKFKCPLNAGNSNA